MRKLIRNKVPELIMGDKDTLVNDRYEGIRKMSEWEYPYALQVKLHEEWLEVWEDQNSEELADCLQVLIDTAKHMGISWEDVKDAQKQKEESRGSFDQRWELIKK